MNFIEELYYGHINPNETRVNPTLEYTRAAKLFCDNEKQLAKSLSGNDLKMFNDMLRANDEIAGFTGIEKFKLGFRLGVRMMCDCYNSDVNKPFEDYRDEK